MNVLVTTDHWSSNVGARADSLLFGSSQPTDWAVLPLEGCDGSESRRRSVNLALRPAPAVPGSLSSMLPARTLGGWARQWYGLPGYPTPPAAVVLGALRAGEKATVLLDTLAAFEELPLPLPVHVVVWAAFDPGDLSRDDARWRHEALQDLDQWRRSVEGAGTARRRPHVYTVVTGITDLGIWDGWDISRAVAFFVATLVSNGAFAERLRQCSWYSDEPLYGTFGVALPGPSGAPPAMPEPLAAVLTMQDGLERVETTNEGDTCSAGVEPQRSATKLHAAPGFRLLYLAGFPLSVIAM